MKTHNKQIDHKEGLIGDAIHEVTLARLQITS